MMLPDTRLSRARIRNLVSCCAMGFCSKFQRSSHSHLPVCGPRTPMPPVSGHAETEQWNHHRSVSRSVPRCVHGRAWRIPFCRHTSRRHTSASSRRVHASAIFTLSACHCTSRKMSIAYPITTMSSAPAPAPVSTTRPDRIPGFGNASAV